MQFPDARLLTQTGVCFFAIGAPSCQARQASKVPAKLRELSRTFCTSSVSEWVAGGGQPASGAAMLPPFPTGASINSARSAAQRRHPVGSSSREATTSRRTAAATRRRPPQSANADTPTRLPRAIVTLHRAAVYPVGDLATPCPLPKLQISRSPPMMSARSLCERAQQATNRVGRVSIGQS